MDHQCASPPRIRSYCLLVELQHTFVCWLRVPAACAPECTLACTVGVEVSIFTLSVRRPKRACSARNRSHWPISPGGLSSACAWSRDVHAALVKVSGVFAGARCPEAAAPLGQCQCSLWREQCGAPCRNRNRADGRDNRCKRCTARVVAARVARRPPVLSPQVAHKVRSLPPPCCRGACA